LGEIQRKHRRKSDIQFQKKSVLQVFKDAARAGSGAPAPKYELIYCAGLFDYLPDRTCRQLMEVLHDWTAPGGLFIATNVEPANPLRSGMEHLLDWNLIYRTAAQMRALVPERAGADDITVYSDATGVNVLLELRKPANG
jgi:extracellular factor (EF) 3-hydroxypalmitic acid methyl ester biosynthesis protein